MENGKNASILRKLPVVSSMNRSGLNFCGSGKYIGSFIVTNYWEMN